MFSLSSLSIALPLYTHIFQFLFPVWEMEKVSRNSKAGSEKTVRYLRFLSSRSRNFRNVTKNYSFLCSSISCAAASYPRGSAQCLWFASMSRSFSLVIFSWMYVLKYVALHDVQLNITQFLCCCSKGLSFHSVIFRSLWLLVTVIQNKFLNQCHMKETKRQKVRSKTESREYYTVVDT